MACFNKNTAEYKDLKAEFGQDIIVDAEKLYAFVQKK